MKFKVGDIVRYEYDPRGYRTPEWLRAKIVKVNKTSYEFEPLEYYGSLYGTKDYVRNTDAIKRIDEICVKLTDEENKAIDALLKEMVGVYHKANQEISDLKKKYSEIMNYRSDEEVVERIQFELEDVEKDRE